MRKLTILLGIVLMTGVFQSCGGTYDLVYNQPVERTTVQINYQYGVYGFGYYDTYGRFYGPNNIGYFRPRVVIRTRVAPRKKTVVKSRTRRGSAPKGRNAQ